jgi:hypothetical protein
MFATVNENAPELFPLRIFFSLFFNIYDCVNLTFLTETSNYGVMSRKHPNVMSFFLNITWAGLDVISFAIWRYEVALFVTFHP